jgi:hypothetical protein
MIGTQSDEVFQQANLQHPKMNLLFFAGTSSNYVDWLVKVLRIGDLDIRR